MGTPPWIATPGPAGLVRIAWTEPAGQRLAVVRARKAKGGRLRIAELHLRDPSPVGLRELRLGAIERYVNLSNVRAEILERMDEAAPDVFEAFAGITVKGSVRMGVRVQASTRGVTLDRPGRKGFDDDFYRRVLRAHDDATEAGLPVLRTLSDASGAPQNTVARWLKEARRRERGRTKLGKASA